ncbi:MAG: helix-turn-helix transcriptional regulator, partial [Thermoguttaceae bacterium]|nr:helix-turn-helix transcriptional regulator [Thermoguttaceae bacterium]
QEGGFLAASYMNDLLRGKTFRGPGSYLEFQPTSVVTRGSTTQGISLSPKIIRALEFIRTNAGLNLRVDDIAHHLGVTRQWAEKLFQKERKCSIHEEIHHVRMNTIRSMVARTTLPFNEIALQCGFESGNHLGILFKKHFGMTMTEYRSRATSENESLEQVSIIKDGSFHILD